MKLIIVLLCTVTAFTSFSQGETEIKQTSSELPATIKSQPAGQVIMMGKVNGTVGLKKPKVNLLSRELIIGNYKIDTIYDYNEVISDEKLPTFAINDTVNIIKDKIMLKDIDQEFMIFDSEEMPIGDYFYRMFLMTGDNFPENLPTKIAVHKTDNPHIYGLGLLDNGTILFPFEGQLIILNEIVPEKK